MDLFVLSLQLVTLNSNIERNSGENRMKLQHLEGDTNSQVSMIDAKTKQLMDELKANITSVQSTMDAERERSEQRLISLIDKNEANHELALVSYKGK